jgi:glycosyltransferase involved in cell wall biosynthesis
VPVRYPSEPNLATRSRKIVFVNRYYDPDQSATSQMLSDLARGLAANGFNICVLASRQLYEDPGAQLAAREALCGVQVHRIPTTRFGRSGLAGRAMDYLSFYFACAVVLLKLLSRGDILVVMTDPPLLSILAAPVSILKRAVLVNWQQDVFPEVASHLGANPLPRWLDSWLRRARDVSMRAAAMNVAIGGRMHEYFAARGVPESKLCVIENWADNQAIRPKPAPTSSLRSQLGLMDRFVVCYSGNLGRAHEFETLLGAANLLSGHDIFVFLMIGGGAKMQALKQAVAALGLTNFRFLPYQPRESLEDSLAAADLHIVSLVPELEGLIVPSKLYGILAAGRPVVFIGDGDGDISRVINRAECGRSVEVGDSSALAILLRELAAGTESRTVMGRNGRQVLCVDFSLHRAIERWRALIGALGNHPATPPS